MVSLARKNLFQEPLRLLISVGGVAFSVLLMLFLFGVHQGVLVGSVSYVTQAPSDLWVCQKGTGNLIRSTSFLPARVDSMLTHIKGVKQVASITRSFASALIGERTVTLFLIGYDAQTGSGGPPSIIDGTKKLGPQEIVIDRAFADKHKLQIGSTIQIDRTTLTVKGISSGTNLFVTQLSFLRKEDAQALMGLTEVASFFLVEVDEGVAPTTVEREIEAALPGVVVIPKSEFISNNREEIEVGFLPILFAVLVMGAFIGTVVISLMLFTTTMEKSREYAVLKALGAGNVYIAKVIFQQASWNGVLGFFAGLVLLFIADNGISQLVPEIAIVLKPVHVIWVFLIACGMSVISSLMPVRRIMRIHPAEVFRL